MIKVAVFAGGQLADFSTGFDVYVGVDRGSLFLIENQLPLDLAVGDFDSVSQDELQLIKKTAKAFVQASPEKDDTDTELALKKYLSNIQRLKSRFLERLVDELTT